MSDGREGVFDFSDESAVGKKGFDDFNDFSWDIKLRKFVKESSVPDSVESFLHVKKYRSSVYVVVKVLAELVSEFGQLLGSRVLSSEGKLFWADFVSKVVLQVSKDETFIDFG